MKGLNVKRIVALGLGAALVGSALAPAVMAGMINNASSITRGNIIDATTGMPVVDIVVGSQGKAPDVVWAGNIAAKVAQLATVDATAAAPTVDYTVGGTTSVTGEGETEEAVAVLSAVGSEFGAISVSSSKMPSLVDDKAVDWKVNDNDVQVEIKETLETATGVGVYAQADNGSTAYAFGEVVAAVPAGTLKYVLDLSDTPIEADQSGMDANSKVDIVIPWLGKNYVVDSVSADGTELVMYADTLPTELATGEKLELTPTTKYAGKTVEVQLVDLFESEVGAGNYEAKWAVIVDGVVQDYYSAEPTYDLKDVFDDDYFTDTITVSNAGRNSAAGTYTATIRTGADRVELQDGEGYPFTNDSDVDDIAPWEVQIAVNGSDAITSITLQNNWAYTRDSGSEGDTSKYVLKVGEEIVLPNEFAKFQFIGFQDKPAKEAVVGVDALEFIDAQGNNIVVPYYAKFSLNDKNIGTVTLGDIDFTFGASDNNSYYWEEGNIDVDLPTDLENGDLNYYSTSVANIANGDVAALDLGYENASNVSTMVNYYFTRNGEEAAIVLKAQSFALETDDATGATLALVDTNTNGTTGVAYYFPNFNDFEEVVTGYTNDNDVYMAAHFRYTGIDSTAVEMYMRSDDTAKVWGAEELEDMTNITMHGPGIDATVGGVFNLSENEDDLKGLLLNEGSTVAVEEDTFVISVPEEEALLEAYLGSTGTTSSIVGGASYEGVAVDGTEGNVTIDAINGTAGKTVVKVGNIVRLDNTNGMGKSIIVGGQLVNTMAATLKVNSGSTLADVLIASGDYIVSTVDGGGSIIVAGYTAEDTATAAKLLIAQLDTF